MRHDSPLVHVTKLSFTHPGQTDPTIVGVNLNLYAGEIVLVAGATGSGKSTLLSCIAGIAPAHTGGRLSGKVTYKGREMGEWTVRQRSQHFCTVLQNVETQIFTDRVWEELAFGLENWNIPTESIPPLIDVSLHEFGLAAQRNWRIRQLSAGQKQRLLLACLLAIGQPVLLLDEPLAYLDASGVDQLLQLLKQRARQGQAVLLVEHRLERVREICDRAYYFHQGRLMTGWQSSEHQKTVQLTPVEFPDPPAPLLLQTQQLSWGGYPPFPDLAVAAGETVLLQGDNGCGKTTLLKLLSGLLKPTTGTVEILGRNIHKRRVTQIAQDVGFVLQNPNHQLFADCVQAEVQQPGVDPALAHHLLEQLNLSDRADQHPQALSQGQKRRLALGAILARQPQICLLDEITVGQDLQSLSLMLTVLRDFTRQGHALILTSHDPRTAAVLRARVVHIGRG